MVDHEGGHPDSNGCSQGRLDGQQWLFVREAIRTAMVVCEGGYTDSNGSSQGRL